MTGDGGAPGHRAMRRLPSWMGSIRVRLAILYSLVLFGLAAVVVAGIYAGVARSLDDETVYRVYDVNRVVVTPQGQLVIRPETVRQEFRTLEQVVNEQALRDLRRYSFGALTILFFGSLGIGWVVAGVVLRPIGDITSVVKEITATDLSRRIELGGVDDELRQLADTFDEMLDRLEAAFTSQQRFIQDASHELRNPLAVMRTNLDLVMADADPDPDEMRHVVEVVGRTVDRMAVLVEDLLHTARHEPLDRAMVELDLIGIARSVVDEHRSAAVAAEVQLRSNLTDGPAMVLGDELSLAQAVGNLLDNAIRVCPPAGEVILEVTTASDGCDVVVTDDSPGVAVEEREAIFGRFRRGPDGTGGRAGLGLSIVAAVAARHGGSVHVEGEAGDGATFRLHLPAVPT